ncbi:Asx homology domain-containing protein [Dactylonectria macrodidyma]|uniref:Asx homology domain-containing protein n=1 Tax=Dactylonectria macrodidyma TaxID=307937 RepID=A0A9P9JK27_9HYPO|nr:Asx homology domain-containing protein [Dactylonectria macrodidyma]
MPPVENIKLSSPSRTKCASIITKPNTKKKRVVVKRAAKKSRWDAESLLSDPKSPLASADLRTILSNPMAWDVLDKEEQAEILALFPDEQHVLGAGTPDACPDFASLMNDDSFRHDCAAYTENIAQGRHDPDWLASAWAAHERRMAGDFNEHLETKFKDDWEVELPPELQSKPRSVPTIDVSESGTKMKDPETKQDEEKKLDKEEVDELQAATPDHKEPEMERRVEQKKVMAVCRPRRSTKPVNYDEKSEDELA